VESEYVARELRSRSRSLRENTLIRSSTRSSAHLPAVTRRQRHLCLLTKARKPGPGFTPGPLLMHTLQRTASTLGHTPRKSSTRCVIITGASRRPGGRRPPHSAGQASAEERVPTIHPDIRIQDPPSPSGISGPRGAASRIPSHSRCNTAETVRCEPRRAAIRFGHRRPSRDRGAARPVARRGWQGRPDASPGRFWFPFDGTGSEAAQLFSAALPADASGAFCFPERAGFPTAALNPKVISPASPRPDLFPTLGR
jgi:hypothetical protein